MFQSVLLVSLRIQRGIKFQKNIFRGLIWNCSVQYASPSEVPQDRPPKKSFDPPSLQ